MAFTFCSSGAATFKAGEHVSSTILANATALDSYSTGVEGSIEQQTGLDFTTSYSSLSTSIKNLLTDVSSSMIAMDMISYDNTGYLAREADMLMNKNFDRINKGISALKNKGSDNLKTP